LSQQLYDEVVTALTAAKKSIRCEELAVLLKRLGFEVRDGRRAGHKVFVHDGIPSFTSSSYNCGHGRNPEIKPAYIVSVLKTLRHYETDIVEYLEKRHEN
jgi:hypothetical protein